MVAMIIAVATVLAVMVVMVVIVVLVMVVMGRTGKTKLTFKLDFLVWDNFRNSRNVLSVEYQLLFVGTR